MFAASLVLGLVAITAGDAAPATAGGTFTTTGVPGTMHLFDVTCVSASTCVAVGSSSSGQNAAAVEIVNGVAGTVATSTSDTARLDRVVCVSATSCLASGISQTTGEVIPITLGSQATLGTPQFVAGTSELFGLACSTATTCVAVGSSSFTNSVGAVVDIDDGTAQPVQDVSSVLQFEAVSCTSSTTCVAAGSYSNTYTDVIYNGTPGKANQLSVDLSVEDMSCSSSSCVVVGYDPGNDYAGAYLSLTTAGTTGSAGTTGTVQDIGGRGALTGVQCPTSDCVAVGEVDVPGGVNGQIVAFTPGSPPGPIEQDPDATLGDVYCTAALSCIAAGGDTASSEGAIATVDLTAPTATVSGTVSLSEEGDTTAVQGAPLQICATDGTFCAGNVSSGDDGSYSFPAVPVGETYVVTAFSPAGKSYTAGVSAPADVTTVGQAYGGVDVTMTPGVGLGAGVSVNGFGGEQNSSTAVPTVNWNQSFTVSLAPSVFHTPTGDSSTLLTVVLTGVNTQTGAVVARTVYAGGEITVKGQPAAVGLPVDPTHGVSISIPALAPIHGPVGVAITYSNSPNPATGVTIAPDPLVLSNGNPTESVTVAATDYGVDHTVGVPTLSGPDSSSFSVGSPSCAGANLVQNSGGQSPNQSCDIPITWHPSATPSQNAFQVTISVPVTNSGGQSGVLQDQAFACDSRIQGNSQCSQGTPPTPPPPAPVGGPTGTPVGGLYVDPSGTVVTAVAGGGTVPVSGATVTLSMQDPSTSDFTAVPNGSAVMSPDNRVNPDTTDTTGGFGWDTVAGTYEITAARSGCSNTPQTTSPITVPPAATGIVITLACPVSQATSTTGLTSSPAAPVTGDAVTLTASVAGSSPTGTVTFTEGATALGSAPVDSSTGTAAVSVGTFTPGPHTVTASYGGDAGNAPSQRQTTVTVAAPAKVATTTTAAASPGSSTTGQPVSYGATVSPRTGSATPSGQVSFSIGATHLCTAVTSSAGPGSPAVATCTAGNAGVGAGTVVATYAGDSAFTGSTGTATETVTAPVTPPVPPVTAPVVPPPAAPVSPPPALSVRTSALSPGARGKPYGVTLAHAGGAGSYSWSLASGKLPAGLKLSPGGRLAGTPSKAGTYSLVIRLRDSAGQTATRKLALKVAAIAVRTTGLRAGGRGYGYSVRLAIYGGSGSPVWSLRGSLPPGLTLTRSGTLTGRPRSSGRFSFVVEVRDRTGATATQRLTLVVRR